MAAEAVKVPGDRETPGTDGHPASSPQPSTAPDEVALHGATPAPTRAPRSLASRPSTAP